MATNEQVGVGVERYSSFDLYDEEALADGILVSLDEAFTQEETIDNRIHALEICLAMQYFLHKIRLAEATDPLEDDYEKQLVERFSKVFTEGSGLLGLYNYCNDNALRYFRKQETDSWGNWRNLADAIRNEISARKRE